MSPISSYGLQLAAKLPQTRIFHSIKYRFQGTFHSCKVVSCKVVKRMFEPTFYHNLLRVKTAKCSYTLFNTLHVIMTLKFIFLLVKWGIGYIVPSTCNTASLLTFSRINSSVQVFIFDARPISSFKQ